MRRNRRGKQENEVGVELKYCEHCGGLWVRERGAGVYCKKCQAKVADLPKATKKERGPILPVRPQTVVEDFEFEVALNDVDDFEAAGGLA
jgi:ribosomal protein L37AE/L43A